MRQAAGSRRSREGPPVRRQVILACFESGLLRGDEHRGATALKQSDFPPSSTEARGDVPLSPAPAPARTSISLNRAFASRRRWRHSHTRGHGPVRCRGASHRRHSREVPAQRRSRSGLGPRHGSDAQRESTNRPIDRNIYPPRSEGKIKAYGVRADVVPGFSDICHNSPSAMSRRRCSRDCPYGGATNGAWSAGISRWSRSAPKWSPMSSWMCSASKIGRDDRVAKGLRPSAVAERARGRAGAEAGMSENRLWRSASLQIFRPDGAALWRHGISLRLPFGALGYFCGFLSDLTIPR